MPKSQWTGFIKDYDGAHLMECYIHPTINYLDVSQSVRTTNARSLAPVLHEASTPTHKPPTTPTGARHAGAAAGLPARAHPHARQVPRGVPGPGLLRQRGQREAREGRHGGAGRPGGRMEPRAARARLAGPCVCVGVAVYD